MLMTRGKSIRARAIHIAGTVIMLWTGISVPESKSSSDFCRHIADSFLPPPPTTRP